MPDPIPLSRRKPCRTCGRPVFLAFRDHVAVCATATGERRFHHLSCLEFIRGDEPPDIAA
jgi:hypothetical protein